MGKERHVALVVEDDPATADQVRDLLSVLGFGCLHASTQEQALRLVEQGGFCFALLDLQIPRSAESIMAHVEAGQSVLEAIRARYDEKNKKKRMHWLPVLIMTAYAKETDYVVEMMGRGADGYLLKPFGETTKLAEKIRDALERSEREEHASCAAITLWAAGERAVAVEMPNRPRVRLTITGAQERQRSLVTVGESKVALPTGEFVVLLYLVAARRAGKAWMHRNDMGGGTGVGGWKGISRLRGALKACLPADVQIDENDGRGSYRLHSAIELGDVDVAVLAKHDDARVKRLAEGIAAGRDPASSSALLPGCRQGVVRP